MSTTIKYGPSRIEQCYTHTMSNGWTIQGHSKAGERTGLYVENMKVCLDAGLNTYKNVKAVFVSHVHSDHTHELVHLLHRRNTPIKGQEKEKGRPVYLPASAFDPLTGLFYAHNRLGSNEQATMDYDVSFLHKKMIDPIKVNIKDKFNIPGLMNIIVEVLPAHHSVDSVGYGFKTKSQKLKPEHIELAKSKTKEDIIKFRKLRESTTITYDVETPEMVFFSDSTIENLTRHEEWKEYPIIICECTGFDETNTPETIHSRGHTHWSDLFPVIKQHPEKEWIIIHTSSAIDNDVIDKYQKILDDENINSYIWKTKLVVDDVIYC
jgi:ribonuclease Z